MPGGCQAWRGRSSSTTREVILCGSVLMQTDVSCFGANDGQTIVAIVNGTAPFTYSWSNGTTATRLLTAHGRCEFAVTVSDSNGCEVIDSVTISEPDQVTFSIASSDANCGINDGFAAVTNISPAGTYSFAWNDPALQTTDGIRIGALACIA